MRVLYRTILYSACLTAVLVFFSVRLYHSPRQVATRLHRTLSRFVQKPVQVDGADSTPWGPLRIQRLVLPAAPPMESRSVLSLEDVTVGAPGTRDLFRRALETRD